MSLIVKTETKDKIHSYLLCSFFLLLLVHGIYSRLDQSLKDLDTDISPGLTAVLVLQYPITPTASEWSTAPQTQELGKESSVDMCLLIRKCLAVASLCSWFGHGYLVVSPGM